MQMCFLYDLEGKVTVELARINLPRLRFHACGWV